MNSESNILKRLLRLFPVKILKEQFDSRNTSNELLSDIITNNTKADIEAFCFSNLGFTKQHVYIFEWNQNIRINDINYENFPYSIIQQSYNRGTKTIIISPIINFRVILSNPFREITLNFNQPIEINLNRTNLIFYITILEKNISSYVNENDTVVFSEKINDESDIIEQICLFFRDNNPSKCDLNRGIKHLWNNDRIDSKYAKWKKNKSTTTEAMDENYTLKSQYPEVYRDLITKPLRNTIFKYLRNDELLPDHFTCDPSIGKISIPLYSKNLNQNKNVVREILSNN